MITSPTVEVVLDDGRWMVVRFGQLSELRPGGGLERLRALKRLADSTGTARAAGLTDAELGLAQCLTTMEARHEDRGSEHQGAPRKGHHRSARGVQGCQA